MALEDDSKMNIFLDENGVSLCNFAIERGRQEQDR